MCAYWGYVMRKYMFALAFVSSSVFSTVASADDWSGPYIGAHAGYASGDAAVDLTGSSGAIHYNDPFLPGDQHQKFGGYDGWIGGGQIGFNQQFDTIVAGVEADVSATDVGSDLTTGISVQGASWDISSELEVLGTVRGRLGFLLSNQLLAYGTGGFAWGRVDVKQATTFHNPPDDGGRTSGTINHFGYAIGGGLEYMIAPKFSIKAEYLYVDLGKEDYALSGTTKPPSNPAAAPYVETFASDIELHTFRVGLNYAFD